jgi:hypothetical protein
MLKVEEVRGLFLQIKSDIENSSKGSMVVNILDPEDKGESVYNFKVTVAIKIAENKFVPFADMSYNFDLINMKDEEIKATIAMMWIELAQRIVTTMRNDDTNKKCKDYVR